MGVGVANAFVFICNHDIQGISPLKGNIMKPVRDEALFGDEFYYQQVVRTVAKIKKAVEKDEEYG